MYSNKQKPVKKNKKSLTKKSLLVIVVVLALIVFGILEVTNTTHVFHHQPVKLTKENGSASSTDNDNKSSSDSNTESSKIVNSGGPSSTTGQGINQTKANDTNGNTSASTSPDQWSTSSSGLITLKSPVSNSTFKSGGVISGTAKVSKVWYRLVDSNAGVIAQGNLNVAGGKFSGTLNFHHYASSGQLDVYTFSDSGAETNEVRINVNF